MHDLMVAAAAAPVSPWNAVTIWTAAVAGAGFLVALGGLWLGIFNYRHQTRRDFPKPRWKTGWENHDETGVTFRFAQEGSGEAQSVELWGLVGKEGEEVWKRIKEYGVMKYGADESMRFTGNRKSRIKVQLRWRQRPHLHKPRTRRSRWTRP